MIDSSLIDLIDPDKMYAVTYSFTQRGTKIMQDGYMKGCYLTEKQIKQLYISGKLKNKPEQKEVDKYLDAIMSIVKKEEQRAGLKITTVYFHKPKSND